MSSLSLACPDWWEKIQAGQLPIADIDINISEAERHVAIFDRIRLPDVAGQPKLGDVAAPWVRDLVAIIFGTVDDDGNRWIREFFKLVPKKNSKTTNSAAIMLIALLTNDIAGGEFYLFGPTQKTASVAMKQIVGMIQADEDFSKIFEIKEHANTIVHRGTRATLQILAFSKEVTTGLKPCGVLIDELHVIGRQRDGADNLEQCRGYDVNKAGFMIIITTQSDAPPEGCFKTELEFARSIRNGEIESTKMLPVLYEYPEEIQHDESRPYLKKDMMGLVHPNLGYTRHIDQLYGNYLDAKAKGKETLLKWFSQHLNLQIGMSLHKDRWIGTNYWQKQADNTLQDFDAFLDRCEVVVAGVDGGGLDDLLGLAFAGRCKLSGNWLFHFRGWIHEEGYEQRKSNNAKYDDFIKEGFLTLCDDATQDIREMGDLVERVHRRGLFPEKAGIGLDPVGVAAILSEIQGRGIDPDVMVGVPQGYKLSGVIKGMERRLRDGRVMHDGTDFMKWVVSNAKTEIRGSATLITKQVSGTAKIDPLVAGFNAFELLSREPEAVGRSIYETRGLRAV